MIRYKQMMRFAGATFSVSVVFGVAVAQQVTWDTVKTHPEMYVPGGTPEGECVGLIVSNHDEMGHCGLGQENFSRAGVYYGSHGVGN